MVFTETNTNAFGKKLRKQVKERLDYYEKRLASRLKKIDVKNAAIDSIMNKGMPRDKRFALLLFPAPMPL